ncbi:MAG TPA: glycosyltransferase family A protein [Thermoleophilaceae bacterium]|jgi:glycosyltransferase involved in cell wall biosynthesis
MRLAVISPVHNEAPFLERVARSLMAQTLRPAAWIVVDDGSDDGTPELLDRLEGEVPFLSVRRLWEQPGDGDRLVAARAPRAFNAGLALVSLEDFHYLAKLDGDIELPPDYFETLIGRMEADPALGIACGDLVEPRGDDWKRLTIPSHHVHGALKLYSRACFEQIGGIRDCLGWDTIDETYARMYGYSTRSFADVVARHHRPSGAAQGTLRGRARHGACAWIAHQGPGWVALRSVKLGLQRRPPVISGFAFLYGYVRAALKRTPRVADDEFRSFVRGELRGRMAAKLKARPA